MDSSPNEQTSRRAFLVLIEAGAQALAATVTGREELARNSYERAFEKGISETAMAEVARMAHLFGGYPRAIQGLRAFADAARKHERPMTPRGPESDRAGLRRRGRELFDAIYADQSDAVLATIDACMADFSDWILEHAYGRVLSRPGLGARERELMAVAALAVLRCPAQLMSHVRGARRLGATTEDLEHVLAVLAPDFDATDLEQARRLIQRASSD